MTQTKLFFTVPQALNAVSNEMIWIQIREDLGFDIDKPILVRSDLFGNVGMIWIDTEIVSHFKEKIYGSMDIIITESYSEMIRCIEQCMTPYFWESLK